MEDRQIIQLYLDRDEQAVAETERKYGGYCLSIAGAILDSREDAEEAVSDTWYRAWNSIPPQMPRVLKLYLAKITRNLAFNTYRKNSARKRGGGEIDLVLEELNGCVPAPGSIEDSWDARELGMAIQSFLQTRSQRERGIFLSRYFGVEDCGSIAARYGLTESNVRKILTRTRQKLKDYLHREGYDL